MRRAPYVVVLACLAMLVVALFIPETDYSERGIVILFGLFAFAFAFVGGLISARRPDNPVGWLMLATGTLLCLAMPLNQYAGYALLRDASLPLGREMAQVAALLFVPALCGVVLMLLVFPSGHLDGAVRLWTARACVAASLLATVAQAIVPGALDGFGHVTNPFAVHAGAELVQGLLTAAWVVLNATFVVALVSLVVRLRSARGHERQQLKWVVYAMVLIVVSQLINLTGLSDSWVGLLSVVLALLGVPVAVAVAILRHRLYDIDVVINRSLVYASLTATLATTYVGSVLVLRALLDPFTGGSELAVAGSTLAVAAVFRPARRRIQAVVDRRFYRSRYDASRTLDEFATTLRHQLDLDAVGADLRAAVQATVQPAHLSLWLRAPDR